MKEKNQMLTIQAWSFLRAKSVSFILINQGEYLGVCFTIWNKNKLLNLAMDNTDMENRYLNPA